MIIMHKSRQLYLAYHQLYEYIKYNIFIYLRNYSILHPSANTASATLTVWEMDVGKIVVGSSYQLNCFYLRIFKGKRCPSWPPSRASTYEIADIGQVVEDESDTLDVKGERLDAVVVISVHELQIYYWCIFCKKGNVEVKGGKGLEECRNCQEVKRSVANCP